MDEQYIIDLYSQLGGESKFGKFEDFKSLITTDPSYQKDFHSAFGENTLGSFNDFSSLVSTQQQPTAPKKKEGFGGVLSQPFEAVQDIQELAQQESVSPSDQSSSVSPSTDQKPQQQGIATQYSWSGGTQQVPTAEIQSTESPSVTETLGFESQADIRKRQAQAKIDAEKRKIYEEERLKKEAAENLLNWRETQALKIQEEEKKKEEDARLKAESLGVSKTPEFVDKLNKIDNTLFYDEEKIKNLNDEFKDYGIVINKGGIFNNKLIARTEDGRASIEIDLTPDSEAQMVEESNKLRKFLNENNRVSQDEDFLSKALRAKNMRPVARINDDGTMSTVKFVSFDNKVIPTLFPLVPGSRSTSKDAWIELPFEQALKVARERGEVFTFKTPEEAQEFAKGSWKDVSKVDIEGDKFYRQKGRDYITEKRRWERYDEIDDIINFFEGYDTKNEEEIKRENPSLFINGKPRYDIKEVVNELKKEREQLRPLVKDMTFLNQEGTSEKMRMDFDSYLAKRENETASEAAKIFREAQSDLSIINTESLKLFGVTIDKLAKDNKYKVQNQQAYDNLIQKYTDVAQLAQTSGMKYAEAKTYYDAKINKDINSDFTDNLEATVNAFGDGLRNGLIGDQLLALTIPGYTAWSGFKDKESAAKYISEKLSNMNKSQSRVMTRFAEAKTARDWWDVLADDPFEAALVATSQSLSQMLPYGVKILTATGITGGLTGAAYGGATTGGAGVLPGFAIGGVRGLRAGQAITGYVTEYTNAIMEAVKNNGYDPLNPESLERALNDSRVWDEGAKTGMARGIPIAVVDYITSGLAGKMVKPASKLSSTTSKMTAAAAENLIVDPTAESAGELVAQGTEIVLGTGRKSLDWNEIGLEGVGSMGTNLPNYALNTYLAAKENTDINLAYDLTDIKKLANEKVSDERISNWANNMEKLGKIDANVNQRIQENIGLRRDANEVLSVGPEGGKASSSVVARTMELLAAKKELTSTKNRQEVYSTDIKAINEELAEMGKTKKLIAEDKRAELSASLYFIPEVQKSEIGEYMIDKKRYTRQQFLDKINSFTPERLLRSKVAVKGDEEVSQTFQEKVNAIQKQEQPTGIPAEITGLKDNEIVTFRVASLEDVPEEFRDKAKKVGGGEIETRRLIFGLPFGKKETVTVPEAYVYSLTGKEAKDYAIQKQTAGEVLVQPEARVGEEVVQGEPQAGPQVTTQEGVIEEKVTPKQATVDIFTSAPNETKAQITFTSPEGNEVALEGNEQVAAQLYDEAVAVPVEQRTQQQNDIVQKMEPIVTAAMPVAEEVTVAEAAPVEQFTEQDRARQQELTDALAKADKRRKNVIVGDVSIPKADVKAELETLNQKEQASQQPAPATEATPAEVTPAERTPEQEADLLEELMSGKKKQPTTKEKGKEKKEATAKEEEVSSEKPDTKKSNKNNKKETKKVDEEKPIISNTVPTSEKTLSTASRLGGVAYELPGGIAIIQAFNLFGQPVYIGYKNGTYTRIDIDSFDNKNNVFTEQELNDLKNLKKEIENQEKKNQSDSKDPFTEQGRVAATDSVPNNIKQFVENLTKALGINKKIFIITDNDFNEGQYKKHGLFGTLAAIRSAILGAKNPFEFGSKRYMSDADAYYIYYDGKLKGSELFSVVSHEIGHIIEQELFKNASKETIEAIKNDYNNWVAKLTGKTLTEVQNETRDITIQHLLQGNVSMFDPSVHKYISSFSEYLADNTAKWARTSQKPKTLVDKFFSNLIKEFKKIRDYVFKTGNYSENIFKWLDGLYDIEAVKELSSDKKISDRVRDFQIKTKGLQSNILGVPIAIWNAGVLTAAKAIDAGVAIKDAISKGIKNIKDNYSGKFNETLAEKKMLISLYSEPIKMAREAGIGNDGIKVYLERKGLSEDQIDTLLKYKERAEKKAPTAEKVVGKPKPKKVTVNEMAALKDQIRLEAKAAREAKGDLNTKRKQLAAAINAMAKSGVMTARQAEIIIRRVNTVNLDNPDMVERLLDYADKVFKDADYASKLKNAKKLQSEAKSLSKNKEKNAEVRELAKEFGKIDPSMVDNIDEYIEMASEVVEGIKGSRLTAKGVSLASAVDINKTKKYIDKTLENQAEKQREMMAAKMQDLMGVDVSDLSYDQMIQLLDSDKPIDKYKEGIIRDTISRMFDTYSTIIESMFKTGKNPFDISEDAETIEFKDSQKELVRNFMSIDLNTLTPREALMAVDALNNFIVNGSTANMETVYRNYLGTKNAKTVKDKGIKGKPLSFLFIKSLGRFFLEEFVSLPLLIESMFKSQVTALYFSKMMGLNDLSNSASQATSITQKAVSNYLKQFSSLKPNKKAFNDAYNATERGMLAFMTRNIIGTEAEMKKEFEYRKKLLEESIKELSEGSTKEQEKSKLYQEAYDKILKDSKDAQEVKQKTDKINADAVDWWINEWSKHYNDMSDVALNVYNKVLEKDLNYTTDRYARLEMAPKDKSELESNTSAYFFNNGTMYKKEAGALKETVDKTGELPKNKDGEVTRYVDLSFDSVQASSLYDAMSDIKTAGAIRQVESFLKSKDLKKVFTPEDLKLLTDRVNLAIRNIRSQVNYDSSELNKLVKNLDRFAKFSATLALAGVTQPFKQTIPLMFNTLVNAGSIDPVSILTNKNLREFINNSGRAIANRGVESQVYIESINRLIDQAATSPPEKAAQFIEKANDLWMKIFLANPDAYIAKASWMAYYEQSLKKQKINTKGIDYATHKLNEEAADYAQMMVDRQQNITDTRLAGAMYSDTKGGAYKKLITRLFLPLASFRLNQYFRTKSDLATLFSKSNTFQDKVKAGRSLTGLAVEMLIFKSLVVGFGLTWHYVSDAIIAAFTGEEEDEEEKEKKWKIRQDNLLKGQATSAVTDLFSPLPVFDPFVKYGANTALDVTQELLDVADENKLSIFVDDPKKVKTYSDAAGMYGIGIDKVLEILKTGDLAFSGEYTDNYRNKKYITKEQQDLLKWSLIPSVILNTGMLPGAPEFNNIMGKVKKDIMYSGKTKNQLEESSAFRDYGSRKEFEKAEPQEYLKAKNTPGDPLYELNKKEKEARDKKKEEEGEVPSGKVSRKPREFGRGKKSSDLRKPREGGR